MQGLVYQTRPGYFRWPDIAMLSAAIIKLNITGIAKCENALILTALPE